MTPQTKALLYNFVAFAILYIPLYFIIQHFTDLSGLWRPITAFVATTILSPKFQAIRTNDGMKIFMSWMFVKGVKEVK